MDILLPGPRIAGAAGRPRVLVVPLPPSVPAIDGRELRGASEADEGVIEGRPAILFLGFGAAGPGLGSGAALDSLGAAFPDTVKEESCFAGDLLGDCHLRQSGISASIDVCVLMDREMPRRALDQV